MAPWVPTISWADLAVGGVLLVAYWLVAAVLTYDSHPAFERLRRASDLDPTLLSVLVLVGTFAVWTAVVAGHLPGPGGALLALPGLLSLGAGLYTVGRVASTLAWYLRLDDRDLVDAGDATEGHVEVAGTAVPITDTTTTPFEGAEALCYTATARERPATSVRYNDAERTENWSSEWYERRSYPFCLRDETGRVVVVPEGADFKFERRVRPVSADAEPPDRIVGLSVVDDSFTLGTRDRRYVERRLEPGDFVYARGRARERELGDGSNARTELVVADEGGTFVVGHDSAQAIADDIGQTVLRRGAFGLLAVLVGYAVLLFATGAL
ncbi:MAG: GIDE domain-containing protein [Haloferacaceae archaeon]